MVCKKEMDTKTAWKGFLLGVCPWQRQERLGTRRCFPVLVAALVFCSAVPAAAEVIRAQDITKFLRDAGSDCYTVSLGPDSAQYFGNPVRNAFDGVTAAGEGNRALMSGSKPKQILYTIPASAFPGYGFEVMAVTVYRLRGDATTDIQRSPAAFTLEALDGTEWKTLVSADSLTWDSTTYSYKFDIPAANWGDYRSYRFTMSLAPEHADQIWAGVQEIVFEGVITPNLVWNGAAGARWNAADANWIDGMGLATNWIPRAKASFLENGPASVAVEGTQEVSHVEFSLTNECTVSGGALAICSPCEILAGFNSVIDSAIVQPSPEPILSPNNPNTDELLPTDTSVHGRGAWALVWRNKDLSAITNFGGTIAVGNLRYVASPEHFTNRGDTASVQFQSLPDSLKCVKVLFAQSGPDIWGRVEYAKYTWASDKAIGRNMDLDDSENKSVSVYDRAVVTSTSSTFGICRLKAFGGDALPSSIAVGCRRELSSIRGSSYLPRKEGYTGTGEAVVCFPRCSLSSLKGMRASFYQDASYRASTVHYFTNDGTKASAQVQAVFLNGDNTEAGICVKVEFTEIEGDVYARAVYAKYDWNDSSPHDFDKVTTTTTLRDDTHSSGYGLRNIVGIFEGQNLTVNSEVKDDMEFSVGDGVTLTFGASAVSLGRDVVGEGTVRFAPSSGSQTVAVSGSRVLGAVAFGGATTLSFAEGASLSVDSANVEDAAAVSLTGATDMGLMRIGTSKSLSSEQRSRIKLNGKAVSQDSDGWIVPKTGIIFIFL